MSNTQQSFTDKWQQNPQLAFAQTLQPDSSVFQWILSRNGFETPEAWGAFLRPKTRILDAGCGNGRICALLRHYTDPAHTEIVGIDFASASVAEQNLQGMENVRILERDLLGNLEALGTFDFIYCQEVLHHTQKPQQAFQNLCTLLRPGGEIAIYVYKEKAPVREFVDDWIRDRIADLPYEEAMQACRQITELGRALAETDQQVEIPAVSLLEIPAGRYDLQRFFYHFFMKCFWNPELSFEENAVVNYDWYHPQLCSRHTLPEVQGWFADAGLDVTHEFVDFYGITLRGRKA